MRTKTLLMTAAALAAGVIYTQAQTTVYSQNVVGYVNITVPANGFALVANQLDLGPGSNSVNNVLSSGLISASAPTGYSESTLLIWNGAGFTSYYYLNTSDAQAFVSPTATSGWYNSAFTALSTNTLAPSQSAFLNNPSANPITVTVVGQVDQGTNTWTTVTPGLNFYSEPVALAGTSIDSPSINFPAVSTVDSYQSWTGTAYGPALYYLNAADSLAFVGVSSPGWYNSSYTVNEDTNAADWPNVGQGFLIDHANQSSAWTSVFFVQ